MEILLFNVLNYTEFDTIVKRVYGRDFNVVADLESGNDANHAFRNVKGNVSEYDSKRIEEFKAKETSGWLTPILLEDLVKQGVYTPGNYLISVSW